MRAEAQAIVNELLSGAVEWAGDLADQLIRLLKTAGDRVAWLEENLPEDAAAERWLEVLREEDPASRALAIRRLARHHGRVDVREALLWSVVDGAFELTLGAHQPTHEAGVALASVERDEWWTSRARPRLLAALRAGGQFTMVGAALALGLDAEADEGRLYAFRHLGGWMSTSVSEAIQELREAHGDGWFSARWPDAPPKLAVDSDGWPRRSGPEKPASATVQRELKTAIAPVLARADVFATLPASLSHDPEVLYSIAQGHVGRGEPVDVLMRVVTAERVPFIPPPAQAVLGHGALTRPVVAQALFELWDERASRLHVPSQYPGVALDSLAASGDPEAAKRYAEWLPHSPFFQPLVPWWSPPSRAALQHHDVRAAAANLAQDVVRRAESRDLAAVTTGTVLHATRDAWLDDSAICGSLVAHALSQPVDEEWFDACLFAFDDAPPQQVIEVVVGRIRRWREESRDSLRFEHQLPSWLRVVERAGLGAAVEGALIEIVRAGAVPAAYRAALVLGHFRTDGGEWAASVATRWPLNWHIRGPIGLDDTEVRGLVGAAPRVWAARMGEALGEFGLGAGRQIVDMISLLLEFSGEYEENQRDDLLEILRELARFDRFWLPGEYGVSPARRLSDCAQTVLFRAQES